LKTIWLEVYANNASGVALYRKMNFQQSGIIANFFLKYEVFLDKIIISREVPDSQEKNIIPIYPSLIILLYLLKYITKKLPL